MRIDRRLVGLGLFLVTAGTVMLAVRAGLVPESTAQRAWTLWPLILVGSGLSIVLAGRPGASLGGLVLAVTFGAVLGGIAATGWSGGFGICGGDRAGTPFEAQTGAITPGASVSIAINCGSLELSTSAGTGWSIGGTSEDGRPPAIDTTAGGLQIESADRGFIAGGGNQRWSIALPDEPRFHLDVATNGGTSRVILEGAALDEGTFETNAGSLTVDLRGIEAIGGLEVRTNLGSTTVHLPDRSLSGSLEVNAGSAAVCVPTGAGLRIELDTVVASNDLARHGLVRLGGGDQTWESPDFASAQVRLELRVHVNAGSFTLDPARECAG